MIEPSTWRRDAPSVRSVANSRVRCAIVIESEFAITKQPTKSAMPPNASRKPWRKVMNSFVLGRVLARLLRRRCWTCVSAAGSARSAERSCCVGDAGLGGDRDLVELPAFSNSRCAVGRSKPASVAPPIVETGAELHDPGDPEPLDRAPRPGRRWSRRSRSPPCRPSPVDHDLVRPGPRALDERERVERRVAVGDREAEVRRAAVDDRLAVVADQLVASPSTLPSAVGDTRAAPRTFASSDSSNVGSVAPLPSERSKADLPVIRRSSPGGRR